MSTSLGSFYSTPRRMIHINPALIAILDRRMATVSVKTLQAEVTTRIHELFDHGMRTDSGHRADIAGCLRSSLS
jgi:hypothetical protein